MTVKELIDLLKKAKDIDIADITFYVGEKTYIIESMGQFGIIPDVSINLTEVDIPIIRPIKNFRRDKRKMVEDTLKNINLKLKK